MAKVTDHVVFETLLALDVPPAESFSIGLCLLDDDAIPADRRILYVTPTSYSDDLPEGSAALEYATTFFAQAINPENLLFGRRITTDLAPRFLFGSGVESDVAAWKAVTAGSFKVVDSEANETEITGLNFSAITAVSQAYGLIEDALAALVTPDVVGLDAATVEVDALGRPGIVMPAAVAGADSPTLSLAAAATGTSILTLLDSVNGTSVPGYDAEAVTASLSAVRAIDDSFYNVEAFDASDADNLLLAAVIEGLKKQLTAVTSDANCLDPASTTDIMAICKALSYRRTLVIYDAEKSTQEVGAAIEGRLLGTDEGKTSYAYSTLSSVASNGLSASGRIAIKDKCGNYIETVGSSTYLYPGINSGNVEKRLIRGVDWFDSVNQNEAFALLLNSETVGFDNEMVTAIQEILEKNSEEAITVRKIFVNTKARPFVIALPDADEFTQAERASHKVTITDAYSGYINSAVNDILVRGTITI